jgi:hypothetical protein
MASYFSGYRQQLMIRPHLRGTIPMNVIPQESFSKKRLA